MSRQAWLLAALLAASCGKAAPTPPPADHGAASREGTVPGPSMRDALSPRSAGGPSPAGTPAVPQAEPGGPAAVAGYIFDVPVPAGNYYFAKRVAYMFPRPWEERLSPEERERAIWEALILHYESFRRGVTLTEAELETRINGVLQSQQLPFTRASDPAAYAAWAKEKLGEDVPLFENQMRYLFQIEQLKDQMRQSFAPPVTEEELQQEFLNERHHVGGEMAVFEAQEPAEAFYAEAHTPQAWEAVKAKGEPPIRPVSLMTLEAYMDLWGIPKEQIYAFHALDIGSVGPPMPFGTQWCVYRLLEKRSGDLQEFPQARDGYVQQVAARKQHQALTRWIEDLKAAAQLRVLPLPDPTSSPPA